MDSSMPRILADDELRLLRRLKLSLWCMTLVFVFHGMPAKYPELYPLTRWAMFSEADRGPKELRQGYSILYELEATDIEGTTHTVTQRQLYRNIPMSTASPNLAFITMHQAAQLEEPDLQAESAMNIFNQLHTLYGEMERVEVWRLYYGIDYDRLPHVDYTQPDRRQLIAVLTDEGQRIEVIEDDL